MPKVSLNELAQHSYITCTLTQCWSQLAQLKQYKSSYSDAGRTKAPLLEQTTAVQTKKVLHWSDYTCSSMGPPVPAASLKGRIIFLTKTDSLAPELSRVDLQSISTSLWTKMFPPPSAESLTAG